MPTAEDAGPDHPSIDADMAGFAPSDKMEVSENYGYLILGSLK